MLNLMQVIRQYLCSTCGSVLKETAEYLEIHSLREECPSCRSMLSESLIRRSLRPEAEISAPKIQTADTLPEEIKIRYSYDRFLRWTCRYGSVLHIRLRRKPAAYKIVCKIAIA